MPIRQRTTKLVARRHDLNYFKRMSPIRAWQWWLAGAAIVVAVVWFGSTTLVHGGSALSAGPVDSSHAVFGERCELCHVPVMGASFAMRKKVPDSACLRCHVASPHHPSETVAKPTCGSCHVEHVGAMHLAAVADRNCTQCHAQLEARGGVLKVAASIHSFAGDHPEFRELRTVSMDDRAAAFALKFDHAGHMKAGLRGPHGVVTLECGICHRAGMDANGRRGSGMVAVNYKTSCSECHSLQFDAHIQQEAPHDKPEVVRDFVVKSITEFAGAHPEVVAAEIRKWPLEAPLPNHVVMAPPRSSREWIANRVMRSEVILWREKCGICHRAEGDVALPQFEVTKQPVKWFAAAVFSHPAHGAVACEECHAKALTSSSGKDLLLPGIETCRKCHDGMSRPEGPALKAGHAESGCFLCHLYHGTEYGKLTAMGFKLGQLVRQ